MLVIAHRGSCKRAPENSIEAFEEAVSLGADGFEFDVRTTADGVSVVVHDDSLRRTTGARLRVSGSPLAQVRKARLPNGEAVPTLEEVFRAFAGRCWMVAELKDSGSTREVARLTSASAASKLTVSSFDPKTLAELHGTAKALLWKSRECPIADMRSAGTSELHLRRDRADPRRVSELRAIGTRILAWNVERPRHVEKAAALGLDGIITGDVEMALRIQMGQG
jgi:glycerophosphoryl diester phosphodiesterase